MREYGNTVDSLFLDEIQSCAETAVNFRLYFTDTVHKLTVRHESLFQAYSTDAVRSHKLLMSCKAENIRSQCLKIYLTCTRCLRTVADYHQLMPSGYGADNLHVVYISGHIGTVRQDNKSRIFLYSFLDILIFQPSVAVDSYVGDLRPFSCKVIQNRNR